MCSLLLFACPLLLSPTLQDTYDPSSLRPAVARLVGASRAERDVVLAELLEAEPERRALLSVLRDAPAPAEGPAAATGWSLGRAVDTLGIERPYQLFVPAGLSTSEGPLPLLVHLHGAVAREGFSTEPGEGVGYGSVLWPAEAERLGFVIAFPLGRADVPWWSADGVRNVRAVVRDVQRRLPIAPDSIVATGFSDGASGCYYLAMTGPEPFAALLPMNGHPRVASSASGEQLYPENLSSVPTFAALTQDDVLYPALAVLPHLHAGIGAGGSLHVVSYPFGGHTPAYFEEQKAAILRFFGEAGSPEELPITFEWRTAHDEHARCRWITITERGSAQGEVALPPLAEVVTVPGRVRLGVALAEGEGVVIGSVGEGSVGAALGLRAGDELAALGGTAVDDVMTLRTLLWSLEHGQDLSLEVLRDGERVVLEARVPDFEPEPVYPRDRATSFVRAEYDGSLLELTTHGVRALRVDLPEPIFGSGEPHVHVNGEHVDVEVRTHTLAEILTRWADAPRSASVVERSFELQLTAATD